MVDNRYFDYEEQEEELIGCCVECGEDITSGYEYYVDYKDNIFCDKECVEKYYGIRSA